MWVYQAGYTQEPFPTDLQVQLRGGRVSGGPAGRGWSQILGYEVHDFFPYRFTQKKPCALTLTKKLGDLVSGFEAPIPME